MNRYPTIIPLFIFCVAQFSQSAMAVTIQTLSVGYAGNAVDPRSGSLYGAVPYTYNIGAFDVTNAQYAEFLNAKASAADPYGLWNFKMGPLQPGTGGIIQSSSAPYTYTIVNGYANKPATSITWFDAVRFVNWLQNGQGNGDTESGSYAISGGGNNSGTVTVPTTAQRVAWAMSNQFHWLLPSQNEWYKAAYYNGVTASYYRYPFQSNSIPTETAPSGGFDSGNFDDAAYNSDGYMSYLTNVGSYIDSISPFGSYDMGGDVYQWTDTGPNAAFMVALGGGWNSVAASSASSPEVSRSTDSFDYQAGFRLVSVGGPASVPEPASLALVLTAAVGAMEFRRRRAVA